MESRAEQNRVAVDFWRRYDEIEARLSAPLSARMLDLGRVGLGMRVLDVATGRGEPAIPAAHRVGADGFVLGIDRNEGLLDIARERATREGLTNLELRPGDAESFEVAGYFDVATMRWALMYFANPDQALACVRRALRPDGALVVAVWAEPERIEYASLPRRVLARYRELPPTAPDAPGVFRFADRAILVSTLERAGFSVDAVEDLHVPVIETPDGAGFVAWCRGWMKQFVDELPESAQRAWADELAREAEQFRRGENLLIGGVTRLVLARR